MKRHRYDQTVIMFDYQLHFLIVVFVAILQQTNGLAVSDMQHVKFCNGDVIDVSCPNEWQIHISTSYFVYVHGVHQAGPSCEQHHNATQQCFRKIQFYDPDYYAVLHRMCQSKQRCQQGLKAEVGDPKTCWDYPHSPSDYLTFSYMCVNVHMDNPTTKYLTTKYWLSSSRYTTSGPYYSPTRSTAYRSSSAPVTTEPTHMTTKIVTDSSKRTHILMTIVLPVSVIVMLAAIITIAAVLACRTPKNKSKSSVIRRRLSENSSVYYNNGDRSSIGGDSVVTRASINGISNPGFDIADKAQLGDAYTDKVILSPSHLFDKAPLGLQDIHIVPTLNNNVVTKKDESNENVYVNGTVNGTVNGIRKEPLSEQAYTEVNETKTKLRSK